MACFPLSATSGKGPLEKSLLSFRSHPLPFLVRTLLRVPSKVKRNVFKSMVVLQ